MLGHVPNTGDFANTETRFENVEPKRRRRNREAKKFAFKPKKIFKAKLRTKAMSSFASLRLAQYLQA